MTPSDAVIAVDSENTAQAAGCHAGEEVMRDAAAKAGKSAQLEQYDQDYPKGPTISRKACALRSAPCESACACVARRRCYQVPPAAFTA